jgi:hypothetical protein
MQSHDLAPSSRMAADFPMAKALNGERGRCDAAFEIARAKGIAPSKPVGRRP